MLIISTLASLVLDITVASVIIIFFGLSIQSTFRISKSVRKTNREKLYEDDDGVATLESQQLYNKALIRQNILLSILVSAGFAVAFFEAVYNQTHSSCWTSPSHSWLPFSAWVLAVTQAILLLLEREPIIKFGHAGRLGASLTLISISPFALIYASLNDDYPSIPNVYRNLEAAKFSIAIFAGFICISYPRRPNLIRDDAPLDEGLSTSAFSRFTYGWAYTIMSKRKSGFKLQQDDFKALDHEIRSKDLYDRFQNAKSGTSFIWTMFILHRTNIFYQSLYTIFDGILNLAPQIALYNLLRLLQLRDQGYQIIGLGAFWVMALVVLQMINALFFGRMWFISDSYILTPLMLQLPTIIFAKSLRKKNVKSAEKKETETAESQDSQMTLINKGKQNEESDDDDDDEADPQKSTQAVVNLVGVDTRRTANFMAMSNLFLSALVKLTFAFYILYSVVGWQALLAGVISQLLFLPINVHASKKYSASQDAVMKSRDKKLAVVNEALTGIRQIKFAALEEKWQNKILEARNVELKSLWNAMMADNILISLWIAGPVVLSAGCIVTHALIYGSLDPATAFTTISLLSRIEATLSYLPELTTDAIDAWVSIKRIIKYLDTPDKEEVSKVGENVAFEKATVAWPMDDIDPDAFKLINLDIKFPNGELSVISGSTGSGKSLLLSAILGECEVLSGSIIIPKAPTIEERNDKAANKGNWILPKSMAFVSQIPWIENRTLKQNIVFDLPFDKERYDQVVDACALRKDLETLVDKDETEIGPNGINLSGGQCWRLTLARALYSRAGILIFDDIFSAVDAHVGRHIYENALTGPLAEGRTRILVSHHVALCRPHTKYEVKLENGHVEYAGVAETLAGSSKSATELFIDESAVEDQEIEIQEALESEIVLERLRTLSKSQSRDMKTNGATDEPRKVITAETKKFVEEEQIESGRVKFDVYQKYMKACGGIWFWMLVTSMFAIFEIIVLGRSWVIRLWTQDYDSQSILTTNSLPKMLLQSPFYPGRNDYSVIGKNSGTISPSRQIGQGDIEYFSNNNLLFWASIYLAVSFFMIIEGTFRFYVSFRGSIVGSKVMFEKLIYTVLRAPLRWLDTVPTGRILNRFTSDFDNVDSRQAYALAFTFWNVLNVVGIIIAGAAVSMYILLAAMILFAICVYLSQYYLPSARDAKRLESTAKSPIFEHFTAALKGVSTIRAYDKKEQYLHTMFDKLDKHGRTLYHISIFKRWFGWRLTLIGAVYTIVGASFIIGFSKMDAALGGFALTFIMTYNDAIFWLLRHIVELELSMNSTERVIEYSDMPIESQTGIDVPASWPNQGKVEVENLIVSYAEDLSPVLKGLNFVVEPKERVGVVGRTGAGKSSLTLALFRFLEAREGSIIVDGIDISKIKLTDLRSRLAIIPQDPVLFSGTIRTNLDPFNERSDSELLEALRRVHLLDSKLYSGEESGVSTPRQQNTNMFSSLSSPIAEAGQNLSQGQRQLLCLARAIVARPRVMVLDEATSAVDKTTDGLIQRSIREEFEESTLLVIAHRLSTIADFDRILVLDEGKVVEYGSPSELWGIKDGIFKGMIESSGEREVLEDIIVGGM